MSWDEGNLEIGRSTFERFPSDIVAYISKVHCIFSASRSLKSKPIILTPTSSKNSNGTKQKRSNSDSKKKEESSSKKNHPSILINGKPVLKQENVHLDEKVP